MKVTIIGHSGSFPGPVSPASCYLVRAQAQGRTWSIALDLGNGSLGALQRHLDPHDLDAIILSHLHPDHCLDVCSLYVMRKYQPGGPARGRILVYGPQGTATRLARAYGVRRAEPLTSQFIFRDLLDAVPVTIGPFTVTPHLVAHSVEAYGIRVAADGQVLAYSGDTDLCEGLSRVSHDADLMLADCAFVDGRDDVRGIHMTGSRAAQAAVDAGGVRRLMLTHIPAWNDPGVCRAQAATVWAGHVEVAVPGSTYEL
ncbi:MAG TPA: MBL fold metallo-hydrolase [Dermatophilaceae bacterium]|nr:MBL fold metallo-hydrolase [Dermatophilaceae bacterium]